MRRCWSDDDKAGCAPGFDRATTAWLARLRSSIRRSDSLQRHLIHGPSVIRWLRRETIRSACDVPRDPAASLENLPDIDLSSTRCITNPPLLVRRRPRSLNVSSSRLPSVPLAG